MSMILVRLQNVVAVVKKNRYSPSLMHPQGGKRVYCENCVKSNQEKIKCERCGQLLLYQELADHHLAYHSETVSSATEDWHVSTVVASDILNSSGQPMICQSVKTCMDL